MRHLSLASSTSRSSRVSGARFESQYFDRQELRRYLRLGADHRVGAEAACEIYLVVAVHPPQPITTRMPVSSQPPPTM
jgi:hypothetical protein